MAKWVLYHTDGCHLCEQAEQLLKPLLSSADELQLIDIMSDDSLILEYQISIPVLKNSTRSAIVLAIYCTSGAAVFSASRIRVKINYGFN